MTTTHENQVLLQMKGNSYHFVIFRESYCNPLIDRVPQSCPDVKKHVVLVIYPRYNEFTSVCRAVLET